MFRATLFVTSPGGYDVYNHQLSFLLCLLWKWSWHVFKPSWTHSASHEVLKEILVDWFIIALLSVQNMMWNIQKKVTSPIKYLEGLGHTLMRIFYLFTSSVSFKRWQADVTMWRDALQAEWLCVVSLQDTGDSRQIHLCVCLSTCHTFSYLICKDLRQACIDIAALQHNIIVKLCILAAFTRLPPLPSALKPFVEFIVTFTQSNTWAVEPELP